MNDNVFETAGFPHEYQRKYEEFYSPYFDTKDDLTAFFISVFKNDNIDKTPRRMMNQIYNFVTLADDIGSIRPNRDPLCILFLRTCLEALYALNNENASKLDIKNFFHDYVSQEGQQYILNHFTFTSLKPDYEMDEKEKLLFDYKEQYPLSINDFSMILYKIRGMAVHEGDYWSMQVFSRDDDSIWLTSMSTDEQMIDCYQRIKGKPITYHFETTLNYEKFVFYFVEGCIQFLNNYIMQKEC